MRKLPILLLALLLLSSGFLITAQSALMDKGDQVTYTPQTISGDPSLTEDLHVHYTLTMGGRLLWDTRYDADRNETFVDLQHYFTTPRGSINTTHINQFSLHSDPSHWEPGLLETEHTQGIYALWKELAEQSLQTGEEAVRTVRLADYYDFYPLSGYATFARSYTEWSPLYPEDSSPALQAMNSYFRIPMLDNQYLSLSAYARESGYPSHYGSSAVRDKPDTDWFTMGTSCSITEDAIYFVFSNRTDNGSIVDTSLIPGGYGIYCLPLTQDQEGLTVAQFDALSTIHSIDPAHEALSIHSSPDGQFLYLLTRTDRESELLLTVVEPAQPKAVQTIPLPHTAGKQISSVYEGKDHLLLVVNSTRLYLVTRSEDGSHQLELITQPVERSYSEGTLTFDNESGYYYRAASPAYRWDGEILAIALPAPSPGIDQYSNSQTASFDLVIFDRDGLQYFGHYESSLNSPSWSSHIYPWGAPALNLYRY